MGKKLAFWGDCNGYGYKIIRILEELGGVNVSNYNASEVTSIYYIDKKNHIKGVYNGDLDKEKYVIMTYHDFISKYPHQVGDTVYNINTHEKGNVFEFAWDEKRGEIKYYVDFENTISWMYADEIFYYIQFNNEEECGTSLKPLFKPKTNAVKLVDGKVVDDLNKNNMGKKLAIKGHSTRGKEVIELLKMLGGCDSGYGGLGVHYYYYISQLGNIEGSSEPYEFNTYIVFTLEEFLEKYPFKVGDKVFLYDNITEGRVTGMKWDEDKGTVKYCVYTSAECWCDVKELFKWNALDLVEKHYDEHCDDMYKTLFMNGPVMMSDKVDDKFEYKIPDGYEFDKIENGKIILKPIKPKYPTTYEGCCEVIANSEPYAMNEHYTDINKILQTLQTLLICRNAYWKIAGKEMELDRFWEPDWKHLNRKFYCIYNSKNNIVKNVIYSENKILAFPTEEMRDAFYENFKDLIEQCKELL